jgi:hypothetical protein
VSVGQRVVRLATGSVGRLHVRPILRTHEMTMAHSPTSQQLQQVKKEQESTQMRGPVAVPTAKRCYVTMATGARAQDTSHLTWWTVCIMVGGNKFLNNSLSESLCVHMHACMRAIHACMQGVQACLSFI